MNQKHKIIEHLRRCGRTSRKSLERLLGIGDCTVRVSEINARNLREHGKKLIKRTKDREPNEVGQFAFVGYYEIDENPIERDLFHQL